MYIYILEQATLAKMAENFPRIIITHSLNCLILSYQKVSLLITPAPHTTHPYTDINSMTFSFALCCFFRLQSLSLSFFPPTRHHHFLPFIPTPSPSLFLSHLSDNSECVKHAVTCEAETFLKPKLVQITICKFRSNINIQAVYIERSEINYNLNVTQNIFA